MKKPTILRGRFLKHGLLGALLLKTPLSIVFRMYYSIRMCNVWEKQHAPALADAWAHCRFKNWSTAHGATRNMSVVQGMLAKHPAPKRILEIGSWQGSSAVGWATLFQNAHITCVDTWQGSDKLDVSTNPEELFDHNIAPFSERVSKIKSDSFSALTHLNAQDEKFDLIYIDASHFDDCVMIDTLLAWRLLPVGGILLWDDYTWEYPPFKGRNPRPAINWFIHRHKKELKILYASSQVAVEKTADFSPYRRQP